MGNTPLIAAVDRGDAHKVQHLLSDPATDCEKTNCSGQTAIHVAARRGNALVLNMLLRNPHHRPELNRLDTARGYAPLHYAAAYGHPECVAALLEAGADPRVRTGTNSIAGRLPAALVGNHASRSQHMYKDRIRSMLDRAAVLAAQPAPLPPPPAGKSTASPPAAPLHANVYAAQPVAHAQQQQQQQQHYQLHYPTHQQQQQQLAGPYPSAQAPPAYTF